MKFLERIKKWKPLFRGIAVEIFYGSGGISLEVRTHFFKIRLPMTTGMSCRVRAAMEAAEKNSNMHDWQVRHEVRVTHPTTHPSH